MVPLFLTETLRQLRQISFTRSLQGPFRFLAAGLDKCLLFLLFLTQQRLYQRLAHTLGETELEDYVASGFLYLAVRRAEERVVTAAAVLGIGVETACAVVLRHHAALLPDAVATAYDVLPQLERARIDVDVTVLGKNRLSLHTEILDENVLLHFSELICEKKVPILAPTPGS